MIRRSPRLLIAVLLHLAFCAALLLMLRSPPPLTIDMGSAADERFFATMLPPEQSDTTPPLRFRWSSAGSRLLLYGTGARQMLLALHLNGDARAQSAAPRLSLQAGAAAGHPFASFALAPGWRTYHTLLPPQPATPLLHPPTVALQFERYRIIPGDSRLTGVPLAWATVAAPAGSVGASLWLALLLTWALALLTAAVWRLAHPLRTVCWLLILLAAGAVLLQAQHDPYTLAWALATVPPVAVVWLLALATVAPALLWLLPRAAHHLAPAQPYTLLLVLLAAHGVLFAPLPVAWRGTAALVLLALPGVLLACWLLPPADVPDAPGAARLFVGLCGGVVWVTVVLLALQAVPGALPCWLPLLLCDAASIAVIAQTVTRPTPISPPPTAPRSPLSMVPFALFLFTGAALRLLHLGVSEFQGDEGRAILMAAGVMHGQDEILLLHRKGPVEILLPAAPMVVSGHLNEWVARLPFALAGIGVLVGAFLLAQRMARHTENESPFSPRPAPVSLFPFHCSLFTLAILALEGYLIAFSRIVQYQSIVALMSLAALWCCWRFYEGSPHPLRSLTAASLLLAVGFLAHYDALYVVTALVWLVVAGVWRRGWSVRHATSRLLLAALPGLVLLATFYLPFVLHERFARTFGYLVGRTGQQAGGGTLLATFNNLPAYYQHATFYNTTYQVQALAVLLLAALLVWLWRYVRPRAVGMGAGGLLLAGAVVQVWQPHTLNLAGINLALLLFGVPLLLLALAPATPAALRTLLLWGGVPFVALLFLINDPRTHVYTLHTPAALLAAMFGAQVVAWLQARRQRVVLALLATGAVGVALLALPYLTIAFVRQSPEYYRTFPAERPPLYRASYGDQLPTEEGYFGFPGRDGWKVVGALYAQGVLEGSYDTNQKPRITGWYTRGAFRCGDTPDYYMLALHEPVSRRSMRTIAGYHLFGYVLVENIKTLEIYSRAPPPHPPRSLSLATYRAAYDALPVRDFPLQPSLALIPGLPQHHLDAVWQHDMLLKGYDLQPAHLQPGESATLSLYWFPLLPPQMREALLAGEEQYAPLKQYELVVRMQNSDGVPVAQAAPLCGVVPPGEWHRRYQWLTYYGHTAFTIHADAHLPTGNYTLLVGLRHTRTGAWLPLADGRERLPIATVRVGE